MQIRVPEGKTLRDYQRIGARHLVAGSALLADEPGTGKTIQVAAALNAALPGIKIFVGCPETLMINWMRELSAWLTPSRSIGLATGSKVPSTEVVIANYDIFPRLVSHFREHPYHIAVLDEAHRIKSPDAQRTQAAALINAGHRWALTGTPIPNRPIETWSLLWWLLRGKAIPYGIYARMFCGAHLKTLYVKGRRKTVWDVSGAQNLDQLHDYLIKEARMLRRRKEDVLTELPEKIHQVIEISGPPGLLKREAQAVAKMGGYGAALAKLQAGDVIGFEDFTEARHELALAKQAKALDFIEMALGEEDKVVVFCHHRDVMAGMHQELAKYNPVMVWGGMSAGNKDWAVRRFQSDPECRVFLGNDAAAEGLTLTAARRCIHVEIDPVPGAMVQKEDRLHRMGQRGTVLVQALVFEGSLDVQLLKLLWSKSRTISQAVDGLKE